MSDIYTESNVERAEYPDGVSRAVPTVVVIETDSGVRWSLERGLASLGCTVHTASMINQVLPMIREGRVDVVVMELLPEAGLTVEDVALLVEGPNAPQVICVSIDSSPKTVIESMRRGASDFLLKPFSLAEIRGAVGQALERRLASSSAGTPRPRAGEDTEATLLIGVNPAIHELRKVIHMIAQTDMNCLIRGESGVGKDVAAREIYRLSQRRNKPFVKVNCSALPEQLLESELFGFERGAFTGADKAKPGRFTLAHEGVIFLDEIGDMDSNIQAKLLQVIEHKEFTPLGSTSPVTVDVQIIAASNADLESRIANGKFRNDLYFRLNEISITVPPLRERREDIPLLAHHFLRKHSRYSSTGMVEASDVDLEALAAYDWPGNVRELESAIKRWLAMGKRGPIASHENTGLVPTQSAAPVGNDVPVTTGKQRKRTPGPDEILQVLEDNQWNRKEAAKILGMAYSTLRRAIEKHQIGQQL